MTRSEAFRHLSKVFAYLACGKNDMAKSHAIKLSDWLKTLY